MILCLNLIAIMMKLCFNHGYDSYEIKCLDVGLWLEMWKNKSMEIDEIVRVLVFKWRFYV
jgi:hypothetical protein